MFTYYSTRESAGPAAPPSESAAADQPLVDTSLLQTALKLAPLAAAPDEAVRRRTLIAVAWPHGAIVRQNTLDAYIARLRRKLSGLPGAPEIVTVHGVGYRIR